MFLNIESLFPAQVESVFNFESELDSLALNIDMRTRVVSLGQRCPKMLQNFLDKEEEYKIKMRKRFLAIIKKHQPYDAECIIKNIFLIWWKSLYNFR